MPTPRPIMAASCVAKSGVEMTCEPRPARPIAVPSPSSAVRIGSPMASTEPKVRSSTIIAAIRPTTVAVPMETFSVCSIAWPPSWTSSCGERAVCATEITRSTAALGTTFARWSKFTVANAIWPSRETSRDPAEEYGLMTALTCASLVICSRTGAMRARTAASVMVPLWTWKTIWSESPL